MLTKTQVIETIDKFPDSFTIDELVDKLVLLDKVEQGNFQSEQGHTISDEDLDKEIEQWFE